MVCVHPRLDCDDFLAGRPIARKSHWVPPKVAATARAGDTSSRASKRHVMFCYRASTRSVGSSSCSTGAGSSLQSKNKVCRAGTTTSMMIGPTSMPPTTTVASGRCTWLPMPVETRGRQQADAGGERGHQHRPHALLGGVVHRLDRCPCRCAPHLVVIGDDQDAVHHRHAEQRHEADGGRDAEIEPGDVQRDACRRAIANGMPASASRLSRSELNRP